MMDSESLHLQVGGALDPERHVYIERPADDELFQLLLEIIAIRGRQGVWILKLICWQRAFMV